MSDRRVTTVPIDLDRRREVCVKTFADQVGVHPLTVYRWIKDGTLAGVRRYGPKGRTIRIQIQPYA